MREIQAVETELCFAQTPVEVAMDDWALATVADLEDRTRIRGVSTAAVAVSSRRRRRRRIAADRGEYSPVGTLLRDTNVGPVQRLSSAGPSRRRRSEQIIAWALVACAALVMALAAIATLVLLRSSDIPVVVDITAEVSGTDVSFRWPNPGLSEGDAYQVAINGVTQGVQTSETFEYQGSPGERVCLTVTVNDHGQLGTESSPKCTDIAG